MMSENIQSGEQEMQLQIVKDLEQSLEAERNEKQKLQTRLKGYETIAKLVSEKENANKILRKKIEEMEQEKAALEKKETSEKQTSMSMSPGNENDKSSERVLNDLLQSSPLSANIPTGSSSFSIIGRTSTDPHLTPGLINTNIVPSPHTQTSSSGKTYQEEFTVYSFNEEIKSTGENPLEETSSIANKGTVIQSVSQQKEKSESSSESLDDFIQVFPQESQSGGSNFYETSFEKEVLGGRSLIDSSRRGPVSMIGFSNGGNSPQNVEAEKGVKKEAEQNEDPTKVASDAMPSSKAPGSYDGTGARPKETLTSKITPVNSGNSVGTETRDTVENSDQGNYKFVKIPCEEMNGYRINNSPMLPFGRGQSNTEISALTSFGSTLESLDNEKPAPKPQQYNNLNMGTHDSLPSSVQVPTRELLASKSITQGEMLARSSLLCPSNKILEGPSFATQAQMIKNILSSKTNVTEVRNIILPFLEAVGELEKNASEVKAENEQLKLLKKKLPSSTETGEKEHPLYYGPNKDNWVVVTNQEGYSDRMVKVSNESDRIITLNKEIEHLRSKTIQLHTVNKEWRDKWEILKKQKEDENLQLRDNVKQLVEELDRLRREKESVIASQKEELVQVNLTKREIEKDLQLTRTNVRHDNLLLEQLQMDCGNLHKEKRALEIQLETMKENTPEKSNSPEYPQDNSDLATELSVVKRQVTLFMDDFNKEHQERLSAESKIHKLKESNQGLESKLKKAHVMLKSRDEDLRKKSKLASDLQFQVDDLKLKLEVEKRRAVIYPSMDIQPPSLVLQENGTSPGLSRIGTQNSTAYSSTILKWTCPACTFENKTNDIKCEVCLTLKGPYRK